MAGQDDILTIPDLGSLLKVAVQTVYGLAQNEDLPALKVDGQWRFQRAAIDSWIQVKTQAARSQPIGDGTKSAESSREA